MNEILIKQLNRDFGPFKPFLADDGCTLNLISGWAGETPGISELRLYVEGINPLSGKPVKSSDYVFNRSCNRRSDTIRLYGDFKLHFDAVCNDGSRIRDFRPPQPLSLRCASCKPKVKWEYKAAGNFCKLVFTSNCWPFCFYNIWIQAQGRFQTLGAGLPVVNNTLTVYLPCKSAPKVIFSEKLRRLI